MEFKDLLDNAKAEAIANTLVGTEVSVWRQICRSYSEKFATPLHMCLDGTISPEDIMLAYYESQLDEFEEDRDLENILDQIYLMEDPEYTEEKRKEVEDFVEKTRREEAERIRLGKPIHKSMKVTPKKTPEKPIPANFPKSGGINLSYLAEEEERQRQ